MTSSFALLLFSGLCSAAPLQNSTDLFQSVIRPALSIFAEDNRAPIVPVEIEVGDDQKVHFHGYAVGFQIYTCNGDQFGPAAVPDATLYDDDGNVVATHFAGPTWRSNSGSEVVGELPPVGVEVDKDSILWLRLKADKDRTHGPGIFANTTFIHRVNTVGGKAPSGACAPVGSKLAVPYTADYFFYRASNE